MPREEYDDGIALFDRRVGGESVECIHDIVSSRMETILWNRF